MNRKHLVIGSLVFLIILVVLSSCNLPKQPPDLIKVSTDAALTIDAESSKTSTLELSTPESGQEVNINTPTVSGGIDSTPTPTATHTLTPTSTPVTPTATAECSDRAKFVSETIPDGTKFSPGEKFQKIWRLQNIGTCTWTKEYTLVFIDGNEMGEPGPVPLINDVQPNSTGEFSITFTAPENSGDYKGNWKIQNQRTEVFGLGENGAKPFWVNIEVVETGADLDLGTPGWIDSFNNKNTPVYTGKDNLVEFKLNDGVLLMRALEPAGDQWRMINRPAIQDFYIEGIFITGEQCIGKDSYGFILRSPDSNQDLVESGYVFGFSCDGYYRFYRMDNGTYAGIQNWTYLPNLNAGNNQQNKVGILAVGSNLKIFINGVMVAEFIDDTYSGGIFGLMIRAGDSQEFKVDLDQIATWSVP